MTPWLPKEIIVHDSVYEDPVTQRVLPRCPNVPVRSVSSAKPTGVIKVSEILSSAATAATLAIKELAPTLQSAKVD